MRCLTGSGNSVNFEFKTASLKLIKNGAPDLDIIISEGTQISVLKTKKGLQFLVSILGLLVADFQKSVNLVRPLSDEQIVNLCFDLINDYWSYRFEDFVAFFQLAKKGVYGKIYDRLDYNTIQSMLSVYDEKRIEELRAKQTSAQESKNNISPFNAADRREQNKGFTSAGPIIGDFINRIKNIKDKES